MRVARHGQSLAREARCLPMQEVVGRRHRQTTCPLIRAEMLLRRRDNTTGAPQSPAFCGQRAASGTVRQLSARRVPLRPATGNLAVWAYLGPNQARTTSTKRPCA